MGAVVAIVGRPNVGKSTLFNRLLRDRAAVVSDTPGTTRDRILATLRWEDRHMTLVDSAGFALLRQSPLERSIQDQVELAIEEADVVVLMVDVREGVLAGDFEIAQRLREGGKRVVIAANKADNDTLATQANEFYSLGLGDPVAISAYHGRGTHELMSRVLAVLPDMPEPPTTAGRRLAIVGRPNVGKSMLLNALVGRERVIVDATPGTTRDAVDISFSHAGETVVLVDTAGMRRAGRIGKGLEFYSSLRTMRAIERCDVALLVLDATEPASSQDAHVAEHVLRAGKGLIIVANKLDLLSGVAKSELVAQIGERFKFAPYAPVLEVSAKLGWGTDAIVPQALQICREREKTVSASALVEFLKDAVQAHPPPYPLRIKAIRQRGVNPPRFEVLVNDPRVVHFSYRRYLENRMRQLCGYHGTPLIFSFKSARIVPGRAR